MRQRGYQVVMAIAKGGQFVEKARQEGFTVYEISFEKKRAWKVVKALSAIIDRHEVDIVNTHSSTDAWLGGLAARWKGKKIVRTRHLSTPNKAGLNSVLLYRHLADCVVTTSSSIIPSICVQAGIDPHFCRCIATGIDSVASSLQPEEPEIFRLRLGLSPEDFLIGTVCFVRSWKGITDLLRAACYLKSDPCIKWVVVGGGYVEDYRPCLRELGLEGIVTFTGHLENPFPAIAAMDLFTLLSTGHEGISQASLQAAYLKKPLLTTVIGGLPEVCIDGETGILVPPFSPDLVAKAVKKLKVDPHLREQMGKNAYELVMQKFTMEIMLRKMEEVYTLILERG